MIGLRENKPGHGGAGFLFGSPGLDWSGNAALLPLPPRGWAGHSRCVEHQSVPLSLHVVILRLFRNVEAIKLQLPGQLLLTLKDHQGHLGMEGGRGDGWH